MKSSILTFTLLYLFELICSVYATSIVTSSNESEISSFVKRGGGISKSRKSKDRDAQPSTSGTHDRKVRVDLSAPSDDSESLSLSAKQKVNRKRPWSGTSYETNSGSLATDASSSKHKSNEQDASSSHRYRDNEIGISGDMPGMRNDWKKGGIVSAQDGGGGRYLQIKNPIKHKGNSREMQLYSAKYRRKDNPERKTKVWRLKDNNDAAQLYTGRTNRHPFEDFTKPSRLLRGHHPLSGVSDEDNVRVGNILKLKTDLRTRQDHVFKKKRRATETAEQRSQRKCKKVPSRGVICER